MRAALDNVAMVEHHDLIGLYDGGQTVRNADRRTTLREVVQRDMKRSFGGRIQSRGGLIEHEQAWLRTRRSP